MCWQIETLVFTGYVRLILFGACIPFFEQPVWFLTLYGISVALDGTYCNTTGKQLPKFYHSGFTGLTVFGFFFGGGVLIDICR